MAPIALTVSLNNFYYWHQDIALSKLLSWIIQLYSKKIDGFEISLPFNQCDSWIQSLNANTSCLPESYSNLSNAAQAQVMSCLHNSIHLEDVKNLNIGDEVILANQLNRISQITGIYNYTTHPDDVDFDRWGKIVKNLDKKIKFSVENMCKRKSNFKTLEELSCLLKRYPNIFITFDTSHWLELGYSINDNSLKLFLNQFADRITKIHLSAPKSDSKIYKNSPSTSHYAFTQSSYQHLSSDIAKLFSDTNSLIVLEGLVPVQGLEILDSEINYIKNLIYLAFEQRDQNQLIA